MTHVPDPGLVPGFTLTSCVVAHDDASATWQGHDDDGEACLVTVVRCSPDPEVRNAVLDCLAPFAALFAEAVPAVRDVFAVRAGAALVTAAPFDAVALPERWLTPAQVVTLGVPLARSIAELHARGLRVGARDVPALERELVVDGGGRPWLTLGGAFARSARDAVVEERGSSAASDVPMLQALLRSRLAPVQTRAAARVARILDSPAAAAAELANALSRAARAAPLPRSTALDAWGTPRVSADYPRRSVGRRRLLGIAAALVALAGVGVTAWTSTVSDAHRVRSSAAPAGTAPTAVAPTPVPSGHVVRPSIDWMSILERLDRARAAAFGRTGSLSAADAPGSPAQAADAATLSWLHQHALVAEGPLPTLRSVRLLSMSGRDAHLAVVDTLPAYFLHDASGRPRLHRAARGPVGWLVTLTRTPVGWRIAEVGRV